MSDTLRVVEQLTGELGDRARAVANCLVGVDPLAVDRAVTGSVRAIAAQLVQTEDDRLAAQTVIDLMCALWPHGTPESCGRADWWQTPVGRLCARSLGHDGSESVTRSVAAAMLGVHPGTVAQLVARGTLAAHPDGGIDRAAVLDRIARMAAAST